MQRVVRGLAGAVGAEQPGRCTQPCPVIGDTPVRERLDRRVREHRAVVAHDLVGLPRLPLGGARPLVDDVVVEVDDLRGHDLAREQRGLGHLQRQAEGREALQDLCDLVLAAETLVHVGLHPERIDLDAGIQAVRDEALVVRRQIEVVEHEAGIGVRLTGGLERQLHHLDASLGLRQARHGVLLGGEHGQDHRFVDGIPQVDHPGEVRHRGAHAIAQDVLDLGVAEIEQPRRREGVPDQGVALDLNVARGEPLGGPLQADLVGLTAAGLIAAPVEGQRDRVEELEVVGGEPLGIEGEGTAEVLELARALDVGRTGDPLDEVEPDVAEPERVRGLLDPGGHPRQGAARRIDQPHASAHTALSQIRHRRSTPLAHPGTSPGWCSRSRR